MGRPAPDRGQLSLRIRVGGVAAVPVRAAAQARSVGGRGLPGVPGVIGRVAVAVHVGVGVRGLGEALLVLARHAPAAPPLACPAYWDISDLMLRGRGGTHPARGWAPPPAPAAPPPAPPRAPPRQLLLPRPRVPGLGRGGGDGVAGPRPAVAHLAWQQQGALVRVGDILVLG